MRGRVITAVMLTLAVVLGAVVGLRSPTDPTSTATDRPSPTPTASTSSGSASPSGSPSTSESSTPTPSGSDSSNPQPSTGFPPITTLAAGEVPPQFVVVSFDGACKHALWQHYLELARDTGSHFTFFLSGLCLVPDSQRFLYRGPGKPVCYSATGFGEASAIPKCVSDITQP